MNLPPETTAAIDHQVDDFMTRLAGRTNDPAQRDQAVEAISSLGARDVAAAAAMSGQMLLRRAAAIEVLSDGGGSVGSELAELRRLANRLAADAASATEPPRRRLFGMLEPANPLVELLDGWERVSTEVEEVLGHLREAQQALRADSAAIAQEQRGLATQVEVLRRHEYMASRIDQRLGDSDARGATDLLHAARQRRRDLLTQLAIAVQGQAALGIVADNNRELINAIENATTTTLAALRTSGAVRQALVTQGVVRSRLAEAQQVAEARGAGAQVEALKAAWAGVQATLDQVDAFRAEATRSLSGLASSPPGS